jgi:hypothetical protein
MYGEFKKTCDENLEGGIEEQENSEKVDDGCRQIFKEKDFEEFYGLMGSISFNKTRHGTKDAKCTVVL